MDTYQKLLFPLLQHADAEAVHDHTLNALAAAQATTIGRLTLRRFAGPIPRRPVICAGITFPNELGVAAGFDKNARVVSGLGLLGFGHVEVGTLTPLPQVGNERPRVFRLAQDQALINRMGFPNQGVAAAVPRLAALVELEERPVVGVSLGKQKETSLEDAANDYLTVMKAVYPYADYQAVNVSSPNTPGLRDLQGGRYLENLLAILVAERDNLHVETGAGRRPLLVKIAPDLSAAELDRVLEAIVTTGVEGIIAANTTIERSGLSDNNREETGGLSGRPLAEVSTRIVQRIVVETGGKLPVIAVGGVFSAADVHEKIDAGATLVQTYTGLVYGGPGFPGKLLREL